MSGGLLATSASDVLVWIVWIVAAAACLASGVAVVSFANPFYSALALIGNLASLAVLFLLLSAEFVAAAQVLIYAGAIVVMFLFVIAYLGGRADTPWRGGPAWQAIAAVVAAFAILVEVVVVIGIQAGGDASRGERRQRRLRQPGRDRRALPHRPPARLRGDVGRAARRGRRRRHPRQPRAPRRRGRGLVLGPGVGWYLGVAGALFTIGALGVLLRRSPLIVLLSLELMLNAANLTLIAFARQHGSLDGQIFALAVMAVAASEVVVGLGLIVAMAKRQLALDTDRLTSLHG